MIFFFLKHVAFCFFFVKHDSWWFCSCKLLQVDNLFKKLNITWFMCSKNLTYLYFFFVKLVACWFFSVPNIYIDFCPCEISFIRAASCVLIFFEKPNLSWYFSSWNLLHIDFFFVKHDACWFLFVKLVSCRLFLTKNLIYLDLCLWETCYILICSSLNLLHVDFLFVKLVHWHVNLYPCVGYVG